jgi:hypothetical protein
MDRDDFIITVYCLVCEHYRAIVQEQRLRCRGFAPKLTDEEVITMEICGEYLGLHEEEALYGYFVTHYRHFFPHLGERTRFVRQAADLWLVKAAIQRRLTMCSGEVDDPVQIVDTLPLPVCGYARARRDRCFAGLADYGVCDAKQLHFYGFKLGLRIARSGMIVHYALLPARPHDTHLLGDLMDGFGGLLVGDKGFIDGWRQAQLLKRGIELITPARKRDKPLPPHLKVICQRWRKRIENVAGHLAQRFAIENTRAHDLWHFQSRLIRKILAHTVCVFLNLSLGRPALDLDDLVVLPS